MDPVAARDFRQLVVDLREEGRTILLTTHDMAEAEAVCDRVALIDHGTLLAVETPRTLGALIAQNERIDFEGASEDIRTELGRLPGVLAVTRLSNGSYRTEVSDPDVIGSALQFLVSSGVTSIQTSRPSLEEVYLHTFGERGVKV
jgi:ABC-2 type transport system ATP-binding protein